MSLRINRNIVECKAQGRRTPGNPVHVLIETLWNVKLKKNMPCWQAD